MDPIQLFINVGIITALSLVYLVSANFVEFRGGWRLAVDVALVVVFYVGSFVLFAWVDTTVHGAERDTLLMPAICLMIMGASKLLYLIIAPFYVVKRGDA